MNSEGILLQHARTQERLILALSLACFVLICCASSVGVTLFFRIYNVSYDPLALPQAIVVTTAFALVFALFVFARFSFGYFAGFYLAAMMLGYVWMSFFSTYDHDHTTARLSAMASTVAFLLPALFISAPLRWRWTLSEKAFDRLLLVLFAICLGTVLISATYNFRFVSPGDASSARTDALPRSLNYLIGITSTTILPFLFACSAMRRRFWSVAAVLLVMPFYYPIAVSKFAFFAPAWLVVLWALARLFGARIAVVLSLMLPVLGGVLMLPFFDRGAPNPVLLSYFYNVNFRMLAVPSLAMDLYNDFFSKHELTYFCQIGAVKTITGCPYSEQLALVMRKYFPAGGTYNASLFATEGIASVGPWFAPVTVLLCGFVIAFGNRASAGLPPSVILVSSGVLVQILLNVPLSVALVTHGGALLLLLWYVTPREIFERQRSGPLDARSSA